MYGDEDEEWADTPEARMYRDKAREDERWAAYCATRIDRLWRDLPILGSPFIAVQPYAVQRRWHLKRWR